MWTHRITVDPQVCHGAPTVRSLRDPVEMIVGLLASGMTTDEVLADYPDLVADDVLASAGVRSLGHADSFVGADLGCVRFLVDA